MLAMLCANFILGLACGLRLRVVVVVPFSIVVGLELIAIGGVHWGAIVWRGFLLLTSFELGFLGGAAVASLFANTHSSQKLVVASSNHPTLVAPGEANAGTTHSNSGTDRVGSV